MSGSEGHLLSLGCTIKSPATDPTWAGFSIQLWTFPPGCCIAVSFHQYWQVRWTQYPLTVSHQLDKFIAVHLCVKHDCFHPAEHHAHSHFPIHPDDRLCLVHHVWEKQSSLVLYVTSWQKCDWCIGVSVNYCMLHNSSPAAGHHFFHFPSSSATTQSISLFLFFLLCTLLCLCLLLLISHLSLFHVFIHLLLSVYAI